MDSPAHSNSPPNSRRPRGDETPSQQLKREKAAERQRRKRERDRAAGAGLGGMVAFNGHPELQQHQQQQQQHPQQHDAAEYVAHDLSPAEAIRRDKVRAAARERQRKHRALVKQKKMRELGVEMGNDILPQGMEDHPQFNGYQLPDAAAMAAMQGSEPAFPMGQQPGGQTFATTLLVSFSCAPLLKQHLLRTLNMTTEELASLEPIIADAWDQWDAQVSCCRSLCPLCLATDCGLQRRLHFEQQTAAGGPSAPFPVELTQENASTYASSPAPDNNQPANEFRARFHRPLVAPSPFQSATATAAQAAAPPVVEAIDPHLGAGSANGTILYFDICRSADAHFQVKAIQASHVNSSHSLFLCTLRIIVFLCFHNIMVI